MKKLINNYIKKAKCLLLILLSLVILIVAAGILITYVYEFEITAIVLKEINKSINTEISIKDARFSVFRKFPHATVELTDVAIKAGKGINYNEFAGIDTLNLLTAQNIFLQFNLWEMLKGNYIIKAVSATGGNLYVLYDKNCNSNFQFIEEEDTTRQDAEVNISLKLLQFTDFLFYYVDREADIDIRYTAGKSEIVPDFDEEAFSVDIRTNPQVEKLTIEGDIYQVEKQFELTMLLKGESSIYYFDPGTILYDNQAILFNGTYNAKKQVTKVSVDSKKMNLKTFISLLPERLKPYTKGFNANGKLTFGIDYSDEYQSTVNIREISALFQNSNKTPSSSEIKLIGKIKNLSVPLFDISASGNLFFAEIENTKLFDTLKSLAGESDFAVQIAGNLDKNYSLEDSLKIAGKILLKNATACFGSRELSLKADGNLEFTENNCITDSLVINLNAVKFRIDGSFNNLVDYFLFDNQEIAANAAVSCNKLNINSLLNTFSDENINSPNQTVDSLIDKSITISGLSDLLPTDIVGTVHFSVNEVTFSPAVFTNINADIKYRNKNLKINSLNANSLYGNISGDYSIAVYDTSLIINSQNSKLKNIDINELFELFNNFGQDNLASNHLKGNISVESRFRILLSNHFSPDLETMILESSIEITDGQLIDFQPLMNLSSFTKVSELSNVSFSTLKNKILIHDNTLQLPQMQVQSSAFSILLSGNHSFDNDFSYSIKIHLLDMMARKLRKRKNIIRNAEKKGKSGIYIAITGDSENYRIAYDRKKIRKLIENKYDNDKEMVDNLFKNKYKWITKDTVILY